MLFAQRPPKNSDMPIEPNNLAENLHIRLVERLHRVILRLETNAVLVTEEPTLIMLSPWMRSINTSSAVPISPRGKENTSSTFCSARIGSPAVTTPTSGTGIVRPHGFSPMMSIARGFVASRRIAPFSSSMERYRCTVELDFSPTADPISRTEGGYPFSTKKSLIYCKISD